MTLSDRVTTQGYAMSDRFTTQGYDMSDRVTTQGMYIVKLVNMKCFIN